jgi:DTW domain-containing protein YfiP
MTYHCVENSLLILGSEFDQNEKVNQLIGDSSNHCVVLYPGQTSQNISLKTSEEIENIFPAHKKKIIFIIDGTWSCAQKMLHRSPNLKSLPQICFTPEKKSEYQIRQQPKSYCVSTLEAVHKILEILEPQVNSNNLLEVFRFMIRQQLAHSKQSLPQ